MSDEVRRRRVWSLGLAAIVAVSIGPAVDARAHVAMRLPSAPSTAAPSGCELNDGGVGDAVGTWYRLDPVLDAEGVLTGQRLIAGRIDGAETLGLELDPESFASGPADGLLVVGSDDGRRSTVRIVDVGRSCVVASTSAADVVRRAVLDRGGRFLYEHRVDRRTRASIGVWRRPVDDLDRDRRVLGPLPANDRIGLVFATELLWSADGGTLVVLSCGEAACVTRLLQPDSGAATTVDDDRVGEALGIADGRLLAYGACQGLPCSLVTYDVGAGEVRTLARAAGVARIVERIDGAAVAFEDVVDGSIRIVDLDGRDRLDLAGPSDGARLVPPAHLSMADVELPRGWFAMGADGRLGTSDVSNWRLIDADDGRALPASEVIP